MPPVAISEAEDDGLGPEPTAEQSSSATGSKSKTRRTRRQQRLQHTAPNKSEPKSAIDAVQVKSRNLPVPTKAKSKPIAAAKPVPATGSIKRPAAADVHLVSTQPPLKSPPPQAAQPTADSTAASDLPRPQTFMRRPAAAAQPIARTAQIHSDPMPRPAAAKLLGAKAKAKAHAAPHPKRESHSSKKIRFQARVRRVIFLVCVIARWAGRIVAGSRAPGRWPYRQGDF